MLKKRKNSGKEAPPSYKKTRWGKKIKKLP